MVQRMWAEASGPIGGAEPLFPGSRRSRSVWDAVRLEVGVPDSCPVVLHSFTQLDPDLPRLEVGEPRSNVLCSIVWGWGISSLEIPLLHQSRDSQLGITAEFPYPGDLSQYLRPPITGVTTSTNPCNQSDL